MRSNKKQKITMGWACLACPKFTDTHSTRRKSYWQQTAWITLLIQEDVVKKDVEALGRGLDWRIQVLDKENWR